MNNNIMDTFNIEDGIGLSGYVIIRDEKSGKIIFEGKNMIVKEGKDALLARFLFKDDDNPFLTGLTVTDNILDKKLHKYSLSKFLFSEDATETTYTYRYENLPENERDSDWFYKGNINKDNLVLEKLEDDHVRLKLTTNINLNTANTTEKEKNFTALCLLLDAGINSSADDLSKIFSRIRFDTIKLTAESSLSLTYYIYF